jgi:hypothetical protein
VTPSTARQCQAVCAVVPDSTALIPTLAPAATATDRPVTLIATPPDARVHAAAIATSFTMTVKTTVDPEIAASHVICRELRVKPRSAGSGICDPAVAERIVPSTAGVR